MRINKAMCSAGRNKRRDTMANRYMKRCLLILIIGKMKIK